MKIQEKNAERNVEVGSNDEPKGVIVSVRKSV